MRFLLGVTTTAIVLGSPPLAAQGEEPLLGRFQVHKTLERSDCDPRPTLVDQRIEVRASEGGRRFVLRDGHGEFAGRLEPDGSFAADERNGELADGSRLRVRMSGRVTAERFSALLEGHRTPRGGGAGCRYAVRWEGASPTDPAADESLRRLRHRAGAWAITMDLLDSAGQVVRTVTGTDTATPVGDGAVLSIVTRFPALGDYSLSWMFRDPADSLFKNVAVDTKGNFWILAGPLTAFVLESDDHPAPGGTIRVRFTHSELTDSSFAALREYSTDQGGHWTPMSRQRFRRG